MVGEIQQQEGAPTKRVLEMQQQGLSNNQIIQVLQREGHEMDQIFNAMNQADIKKGVDFGYGQVQESPNPADLQNPVGPNLQQQSQPQQQGDQPFYTQPEQQGQFPPLDQNMGAQYPQQQAYDPSQQQGFNQQQMQQPAVGMPPMSDMGQPMGQPDMGVPQQDMGQPMGQPEMGMGSFDQSMPSDRERIEELAEAIIDEKWNEIVRSINKIIDWKERMDSRISKMEQEFEDMKKNFDTLHGGVLGKVAQYDKNLSNVGTSIKAMEQVFQKVLPTMTENVNELSRISKNMRK